MYESSVIPRVPLRWVMAAMMAVFWSMAGQTESAEAQWLKNIIERVVSGDAAEKRDAMDATDPSEMRGASAAKNADALLSLPHLTLRDAAEHANHDYPEAFLHSTKDDSAASSQDGMDSGLGYRVQILSTRSIALADSVQLGFRVWADSTFSGAVPAAYLFFKPPHYRIHVGDFTDREQANRFARLIKRRYADAWVVYDRIDPERAAGSATLRGDEAPVTVEPQTQDSEDSDSESDIETEQ